jgi:hypothetical protein
MKHIAILLLLLTSCAGISSGRVYDKEYSTRVIYHDQPFADLPHFKRTIIFGGWVIHYKRNGKENKCQVSETVYNIMNIGDYFDCSALGLDADELWLRLRTCPM